MITPPYHCELQPIEKVWSIVKTPISFDPDLSETAKKLEGKLDNSLKNVPEESLLSLWKDCVNKAKEYKDEFLRNNLTIEPEEEKRMMLKWLLPEFKFVYKSSIFLKNMFL